MEKLVIWDWQKQIASTKENKAKNINIGDYVKVNYLVVEGENERIQAYEGIVIAKKGGDDNLNSTITVRRTTKGYNIERVFPCFSARISEIKVTKHSKVRRAKLFYLRKLSGKKARLREKARK